MDPCTRAHTHCFDQLASEYPRAAEQLNVLTKHLAIKHERLAALVRFCAAHPELPMMRMYAEYSTALDAVALEPPREEAQEVSDEEAARLSPRERAARTKRIRTRLRVVETASGFILERDSWRIEELAAEAGIGEATVHNRFHSRSGVVVAAYGHLLAKS
jgi:hypothetical protein